jgi:hypothetical protein
MPTTENFEYISRRVGVAGAVGAFGGAFLALYRGHDSVFRTSSRTAMSCALVGTACFSFERVVHLVVSKFMIRQDDDVVGDHDDNYRKQYYLKLYTYTLGGVLSGAWLGSIYARKSLRGALCFGPLMLLIAVAEEKLTETLHNNPLKTHYQQQHQKLIQDNNRRV